MNTLVPARSLLWLVLLAGWSVPALQAQTSCDLYPIALPASALQGKTNGATLPEIFQGDQPGNFGWLTWAGSPSEPTLVSSLVPPGNSSTYVNPDNAQDHHVSVGDWARGKPGVSNSKNVRDALDALKQLDITVPVWNQTRGQGANAQYHISGFARLRLLSYQLPGQNRITARFLGLTACDAQNQAPLVNAGGDQTILLTDVATLSGSATDDDLPAGATLAPVWSVLSGPGPVQFGNSNAFVTTVSFSSTGRYDLRLTVSDSQLSGSDDLVILVNQPNRPPEVPGISVTNNEDVPVNITLTGSDPDNNSLTFSVVGFPSHGTLSGTPPNLLYTPVADFNGSDSFTYKANDGELDSAPGLVSITILPVNDPPVGDPQTVGTPEDTPVPIVLSGSDVEGSPLTFEIVHDVMNGFLTQTESNLIYTPSPNSYGPDQFTFRVNDGTNYSAIATVVILVEAINDAPFADAIAVSTAEDTSVPVLLSGFDVEGNSLAFVVTSQPQHGVLTGTAPNLRYTPAPDFNGADSFAYRVNDGDLDSEIATVSITVDPVNDAPLAQPQLVSGDEDTDFAIALAGTDVDEDTLAFTVLTLPAHGILSGTAPNVIYRPDTNYNGADSFTFKVNDGVADSAAATVQITVNPVNDAPQAAPQALSVNEDAALDIILAGTDVDGDGLDFEVLDEPAHGILVGIPPDLTYFPFANYFGPDSFTFQVDDGYLASTPTTIAITVLPVNDPPAANDQFVPTAEDVPVAITLSGSDVEGDALAFVVIGSPVHGSLSGTAPNLVYTPAPNFFGNDSFAFKVNDGQADSPPATVAITVAPVNDRPVAIAQSVTTAEDTALSITLNAADIDGDTLSYSIVTGPAHGTLSGTPPNVTYLPGTNYTGADSFTFKANDGALDSLPATISITVYGASTNRAPVVSAGPDHLVPLQMYVKLNGSATDDGLPIGSTLSLQWEQVSGPAGGGFIVESNTATTRVYIFLPGTYVFRLTASDSLLTASDEVTVTAVPSLPPEANHPPVVDVGPPRILYLPTNTANLAGQLFDDGRPANSTLEFTWSVCWEYGGTASLTGTNGLNPTVTLSDAGWYVVCLEASDGEFIASSYVDIVVEPADSPNIPPLVNAGPDQFAAYPNAQATLHGTAIDDGPPDHLYYYWQQASGPAPVSFAPHPYLDTVTVQFPLPGVYKMRLLVYDDFTVGWDEMVVTVLSNQHPPVASSGNYWTFEESGVKLYLQATDEDGDPLTYRIATPPAHGRVIGRLDLDPPKTYYVPDFDFAGMDSFTYVANDGIFDSAPATVTIDVNWFKDAPVLIIRAPEDGSEVIYGQPIPITIQVINKETNMPPFSLLADGNLLATFTGPPFTFTWSGAEAGLHELVAIASDQYGVVAQSLPVTFSVVSNTTPFLSAGPDQLIVFPGEASLKGTLRIPPSQPNTTTNIAWRLVTGPGTATFSAPAALATVATFSAPGSYNIELKVTTDFGVLTDTVTVEVLPAAVPHLTAVRSHQGRDFWITFLNNFWSNSREVLMVSSEHDCTGEVEFYDYNYGQRRSVLFSVQAHTATPVPMRLFGDPDLQRSDWITNNAIHLTASADVSVYGLNARAASADGFLAMPRGMLGTNYLVLTYPNTQDGGWPYNWARGSQFAIVGTEDNTTVEIVPSATTGGRSAGVPYRDHTSKRRNLPAPERDADG